MIPSRRPTMFWNWFAGAFLGLACLASVFIVKAMQPVSRPLDVAPASATSP
jgi:hypothetical protein